MSINYIDCIQRKVIPFTVKFKTPNSYNSNTDVYFNPVDKSGTTFRNATFAPEYTLTSSSVSLTYDDFKSCYDKTDLLLHVYIKDKSSGNILEKYTLQRLYSIMHQVGTFVNIDFAASATTYPNNVFSSHIQLVTSDDGLTLTVYTTHGLTSGICYYIIREALANASNPAVSFELSYM